MTPPDAAALRALLAKATDSVTGLRLPLRRYFSDAQKADHIRDSDGMWACQFGMTREVTELIVAAVNALPGLLDENERLRAHLAEEEAARYEWSTEDRAENEVLAAERDEARARLVTLEAENQRLRDQAADALDKAADTARRIPSPFADNVVSAVTAALRPVGSDARDGQP